LQKIKRPSRSEHRYRRRRALYRRRRFAAVCVLAVLFFGIGTQAAALREADRVDSWNLAQSAGRGESSGIDRAAFRGSGPAPAELTSASPAATEEEVLASRTSEPTAKDDASEQAREEARRAEREAAEKQLEEASDEPLDVLVLGVDERSDSAEGEPTRSDTMMLVRVTPATGEVKLLSVPRDLYVEIEPGVKEKINAAYAYGGVDQARAVMEGLTGVDIDNHVVVDFEGFREVIDVIGGVKVDVGHGVFPEKWHMGEGVQRLGGRKALFYARYRGTPRADLDRIDHQQKLLAALRRQAFRWNTVTKVPGIVKAANDNVGTDLGVWQVIPLARGLVLNGREGKMTSSELRGHPNELDDGEQVLVPEDEANEAILQEFRE
jgi:polyisoprenyl-teichoic acid--peptidoglycan teichoic acid transferase